MKSYIKNNVTNQVEKAVTRCLTSGDLDELMRLQETICAALTDKSLYIPSPRTGFEQLINGAGEIHGIFTRDTLCGVCSLFMPGDTEENLGRDIGIMDSELSVCAMLTGIMVAPEYRQNGIARELINLCIRRAVDVMGARYVIATVSPKDTAGILSIMSLNKVRLKALKQKYGCKLRYIICYQQDDKRLYTVYNRYSLGDVYSISKALADGYEGIATFRNDDGTYIWLAK